MTTFQVAVSDEMADALQLVTTALERTRHQAGVYVAGLRDASRPGNGWPGPGEMPWGQRAHVAAVAREVAAAHPEHAERLEGFASGLEACSTAPTA